MDVPFTPMPTETLTVAVASDVAANLEGLTAKTTEHVLQVEDMLSRADALITQIEKRAAPPFPWAPALMGFGVGAVTSALVVGGLAWLEHRSYTAKLAALKAAGVPANDAGNVTPMARSA